MPSKRNQKDSDNKISHYLLDELLVEQTVSAIYRAQDEKADNPVFLVTLQPDVAKSGDLTDRFQRRAETLAQLEHETILPLLDYGIDGKRPYAVMAYIPGQFLAERLEAAIPPEPNDKAKVIESLKLVNCIAAGLSVAHPTGLIHHDLRPENIYLDESGQPYLIDLVVPPTPPVASQIGTTPPTELDYQSPEQLSGKALSGRSNVFSLGILLYRLLAGQKPALPVSEWDIFEHKGTAREVPLNKVRPDLSEATYRAVQDSIWQKEWSRFETVAAQIKAIDRALRQESAPPPPPPPTWRKILNRLREPKILRIVIPAIVLLFLLLLVLMFMRGRANRQRNMTPTPDSAVLPLEADTAVIAEPANESTTPTATAVPTIEETETPTARPNPTNTAVPATPTEPAPTPTASSTVQAIDTPTLEPTEVSCIPSPPFGWVRYTIQANDSLSAISQATNTTVERLQEVNCLETILLSIGQTIWVPSLSVPTETPTAVPPSPGNDPSSTSEPPTPTIPSP